MSYEIPYREPEYSDLDYADVLANEIRTHWNHIIEILRLVQRSKVRSEPLTTEQKTNIRQELTDRYQFIQNELQPLLLTLV